VVPHLYAVLSCEAEQLEYGKKLGIRVVLLDEDNDDEVLALEGVMEVGQPKRSTDRVFVNQVVGLNFIRFEHPGNFRFSFLVEDKEITAVPLRVNKLN
jgi:hypothetical protein